MNLSSAVAEYISNRSAQKLEKFDKETTGQIQKLESDATDAYQQQRVEQRQQVEQEYRPRNWLDSAVSRANQIQLATHAPKYSHPDAKGGSVNALGFNTGCEALGTHSIVSPTIDVTGNAAALDVANLLLLQSDGHALWQQLLSGDTSAIEPFAKSKEQLTNWLAGFQAALQGDQFFSHTHCKQLYFPVEQTDYHLIAPLFASSLCHAMHEQFRQVRFDDPAITARKQRRESKGSLDDAVYYPNIAEMSFGGSKPQNISLLNSQRRGTATLLCGAPPVWVHKERLPVKGKGAFWRTYSRQVRTDIRSLNTFLDRVKGYTNMAIRRTRAGMVTQLVDDWLYLVARVRNLGEPGWSAASDLSIAEQCLLDPQRTDDDSESKFQQMLDDGSWRHVVADQFGLWLNRALSNKARDLGDTEATVWAQEVSNTLSRLRNDLEYL